MAVELKGVRISYLTLTTGNTVPVIKAIVAFSGNNGFDSTQEYNDFLAEVYGIVKGRVAACAIWYNEQKPELIANDLQTLATGSHTQGDDTGLKITFNVSKSHNIVNNVTGCNIFYEGSRASDKIADYSVFTGYADFEASYAIVLATEDNKMVRNVGGYSRLGLYVKYTYNPGVALLDSSMVVVGNIMDGELYRYNQYPRGFDVTTVDLSQYISNEINPENTDPFAPAGGNDGGGGTGNFDDTSDTIPVPSLPSVSITDSGFLTLFATNQAGLRSLSNYLWSDLFSAISPQGSMEETITTLKKVVANPYDAILGCSLVPVTVPVGTSKDVKLYGVLNSGVTLPVASTQYVAVDCGTLNINEYWGAYLDYAPYTKVTSLYLPYVGVVSIDTDLIMGKALQVIYHVDILSGQCVAYIVINGSVEFQYMGHCATPIPVTSIDYSSTIQAGLGLVGSIANIAGSAVGGALGGGGAVGALTGGAKSLMGEAGSIAQNVMNSKPDIKSGSGIGGMGGMMSVQKPFLIIERPRQSLPTSGDLSQNHWTGYPSNMARKLGDLSGYTEVSKIFVNRTTATAEEKEEITRLLTEGVYI